MDSRPVNDWRKQSFDLAAESTKQLIAIATGVITVTVLFSKDLDSTSRHLAFAAWFVLTLSVTCGVWAMLNMSGNLNNAADGKYHHPTVNSFGVRFFSIGQIGLFVIGLILVFVFGYFAAGAHPPSDTKPVAVTVNVPPQPPPTVTVNVPATPPPPIHHIHRRRPCTCRKTP
jgi:hypothetical protein